MRVPWDETWLGVARVISERSFCVNRNVGCVIVDTTNRVIATGYNGAPRGFSNAPVCAGACPRGGSNERGSAYDNCISIHAEANALIFADRSLISGGTAYITNPPCFSCAKLLANSGVARVVCFTGEVDSHADIDGPKLFLEKCGVKVEFVQDASI